MAGSSPFLSQQIPFVQQSSTPEMRLYAPSTTAADCPHAIDEDLHPQESIREISEQTYPRPIDDDILETLLYQEIAFYSRASGAVDRDAKYFDDLDLYGAMASSLPPGYVYEDDYPHGFDDDDEDSYTRDPDLRAIFEQGLLHEREKWGPFEFHGCEDFEGVPHYFDATDLYECTDFPELSHGEDTGTESDTSGESNVNHSSYEDGDFGGYADEARQGSLAITDI